MQPGAALPPGQRSEVGTSGSAGAPWGGRRVSGDGVAQSGWLWGEPGREARAFPGAPRSPASGRGGAGDPVRAGASRAGLRAFPLAAVSEACLEPLAARPAGGELGRRLHLARWPRLQPQTGRGPQAGFPPGALGTPHPGGGASLWEPTQGPRTLHHGGGTPFCAPTQAVGTP